MSMRTNSVIPGWIVVAVSAVASVGAVDARGEDPRGWEQVTKAADPARVECECRFEHHASGAKGLVGGWFPGPVTLSAPKDDPAPADATDARVGVITLEGIGKEGVRVRVACAGLGGDRPRVWVDRNIDGALGANEEVSLERETYVDREGRPRTRWAGMAMVAAAGMDLGVGFVVAGGSLTYHGEWYREGQVTLGGRSCRAVLFDELARGSYVGAKGGNDSGVRLYVDLNGNGKFDRRGESFDPWRAFKVGGVVYRVREMSVGGERFVIERSEEEAEEVAVSPDIRAGSAAPSFSFVGLDNVARRFPEDYRGKVVVVHFWTSTSPTVREEVRAVRIAVGRVGWDWGSAISVCLDAPKMLPGADRRAEEERVKVAARMGARRGLTITWPTVCDARGLEGDLARKFEPGSNPRVVVLDADTMRVIGASDEYTPESLTKVVEDAVKAKKAAKRGAGEAGAGK